MSAGILTENNLFPYRQYAEAEVINEYALLGTGLNGMLVTYVTGNQAPDLADGYSTDSVGAAYTNTVSTRYYTNRTVRPAAFGDTKYECAGITLSTTAIYEENGLPIVLLPPSVRESRGFILTGTPVPFVKRGKFTVALSQLAGTQPFAGYPIISTGNGQFACVTPASTTGVGSYGPYVVGKCVSASGSAFNGYAQIEINL
jgi:hypothetical protein